MLQAAVASLQAEAEIDWEEVGLLYERLERLTGAAKKRRGRRSSTPLRLAAADPERRFLAGRLAAL